MNLLSSYRLLLTGAALLVSIAVRAQVVNPGPTSPQDSARAHGENASSPTDSKEFANPSVLGMGPSKGLIVRYERAPDFSITSTGKEPIRSSSGQIAKLNVLTVKAYAPLWNHPHLKIVLGFNFEKSQYNFENREQAREYPLYAVIDDRNLRTIGSQLVILRPIDGRRYFLIRGKGELNGDYKQRNHLPLTKYLRYSAEAFYGWKRSPRESIAIGAQYGYTFGRISIFPGVIYNRTWSDQWGFEGLLPAKARVRYNLNAQTLFYGGYEVQGNAYTVNLGTLGDPVVGDAHELRRTDIAAKFRAERELLPFLWVAVDAGYRHYVSFRVFDEPGIRTTGNRLIDSSLGNSGFIGLELFVTPPRKRILKQ